MIATFGKGDASGVASRVDDLLLVDAAEGDGGEARGGTMLLDINVPTPPLVAGSGFGALLACRGEGSGARALGDAALSESERG